MGKLPNLVYGDGRARAQSLSFGGVDYTPGCAPGSWEWTENMSSREYPALVPRESREIYASFPGATAMYVHGEMAIIAGTEFYYAGQKIGNVSPGKKQIAVVGDWICIFPDKVYYNMANGTFTQLELTLVIPDSLGLTASGKQLKIPGKAYTYADTGAGSNLSGYGDYGTLNPTVLVYEQNSDGEYDYQPKYLNQVTTNNTIKVEDTPYKVISTKQETREYWPGQNRQYVTIEYGTKSMWGESQVLGTLGGWAMVNAGGESAYAKRTAATKWALGYDYTNQVITGTKTWDPTSYGTKHYLNELKIGDIVAFEASTMAYETVETIERTLYTDHYYYNEIKTRRHEIYSTILNPTPATLISENAITSADRLRLSAGDTAVETRYVSHNANSITFADSIAVLSGRGAVTIQRIADPDLDFICEHNNRLWGVAGDKIYASKLGDPKVFTAETTTQVDPWNTQVGTDGEWTGIVSYSGAVLAFKEHVVHKVLGTLPENYVTYTYNIEGIKKGCHASAAIVGEVLYYYAPGGVYAYAGAAPSLVSANFGVKKYGDAVAGTDGSRYYLSAKDEERGEYDLHVLDTQRGIWLREDGLRAGGFDWYESGLYALDLDTGNILKLSSGDEEVAWSATSGKLFEDSLNRRRYTKLVLRADLGQGSEIHIDTSRDDGEFTELYQHRTESGKTIVLPVMPGRADNFRIRIRGKGFVRIRGLAREYKEGSEL